jgi:hypothetical protein
MRILPGLTSSILLATVACAAPLKQTAVLSLPATVMSDGPAPELDIVLGDSAQPASRPFHPHEEPPMPDPPLAPGEEPDEPVPAKAPAAKTAGASEDAPGGAIEDFRERMLGPLPPCALGPLPCAVRNIRLLTARLHFGVGVGEALIDHLKEVQADEAAQEAFAADAYSMAKAATQALKDRPTIGPPWWQHPALWFAIGAVTTGALVVGLGYAVAKLVK